MRSMTGYGSASHDSSDHRVTVRIRTVNHRFLDLVMKMPEEYREMELQVRERVSDNLRRGRVEVRIDLDDRREREVEVHVNPSWIEALKRSATELEEQGLELGPLRLNDLLRIPDAVRISSGTAPIDQEISAAVLSALDAALEDLVASRDREGGKLQSVLIGHLDQLADLVDQIAADQETIRCELETRYRTRIEELAIDTDSVEESRVAQEIAILVERADVREELNRLMSHQASFRETMAGRGAIGKKLDFISQEISRELTTLGAKCRHAGISQRNVDAKLVCEQIREQLQNIE